MKSLLLLIGATLIGLLASATSYAIELPNESWAQPFHGDLSPRNANAFSRCNDSSGFPVAKIKQTQKESFFHEQELSLADCYPTILYSWGSQNYVTAIIHGLESAPNWKIPVSSLLRGPKATLSMALTPASTIMYGESSIRIKLKKGIKYRIFSGMAAWTNCDELDPRKNLDDTVFVLSKPVVGSGVTYEIAICNFNVIDSISTGTERHYDETLRDLALLASGSTETYSYIQYPFENKVWQMIDINFEGREFLKQIKTKKRFGNSSMVIGIEDAPTQKLDGQEVNEKQVKDSMRFFYNEVLMGNQRFLSNPSLSRSSLEWHFQVDEPLAFH
jgi:hypothetical protein